MTQETIYTPIDPALLEEYNRTRSLGPKPLFCYVPFNNIFFSFSGKVISCPYNQHVVLGKYPEQSVKEIWYSEEGGKLRAHLEHNDLSNGCKHCQHYLEKKKFSGLKPLVFDQYSEYAPEQMPKVLEFSLENTCNLECIMCSGEVSSSIRKNRDKLPAIQSPYDDEFVRQLEEFIPPAHEAKFYGGEPFMTPIYFSIWDKIYELNKGMKLFTITNGTKLNTRIKEILSRQKFEIAVSIDGYTADTYHRIRKNADFDTVMKNTEYFNDYCINNGYQLTISFTAMRENWHELPQMVKLCNKLKAHIYISYVHKPFHLALWNLPSHKLKEMIDTLTDVSLPIDSFLFNHKKFNKQAYADFITYLQGCYEKNLQEELSKQKQFSRPENETPVIASEAYEAPQHDIKKIIATIEQIPNAIEVFEARAGDYKNKIEAEMFERFYNKVHSLYQASGIDENIFYTLLTISPIEVIVEHVTAFPESELLHLVQSKAREVK